MATDCSNRKATADDLAERCQIRIDIPQALGAAIAEPKGNDLIKNQQCPDLARNLAERRQYEERR